MKVKNFICFLLFFLFSNVYSQQDSTKFKTIHFSLKLGINTNFLTGSQDYKTGFTGVGIFIEPYISPEFSIVLSYNSLNISNKTRVIGDPAFTSKETIIKFRYRFVNKPYSIFPEIGIGGWGSDVGCTMIGAGIDYDLSKHLNASFSFDYTNSFYRILDVGGGGWVNNFIYINLSFSYRFFISKKIKPNRRIY